MGDVVNTDVETWTMSLVIQQHCSDDDVQGRINHGAKRAMAQGPPPP